MVLVALWNIGQLKFLLYVQSEELYQVGRWVGKIITILSFRVHTSENKDIDH